MFFNIIFKKSSPSPNFGFDYGDLVINNKKHSILVITISAVIILWRLFCICIEYKNDNEYFYKIVITSKVYYLLSYDVMYKTMSELFHFLYNV